MRYLALAESPAMFPQDFRFSGYSHCSKKILEQEGCFFKLIFAYEALTLSGSPFQGNSANKLKSATLGYSLFARRYLGNYLVSSQLLVINKKLGTNFYFGFFSSGY